MVDHLGHDLVGQVWRRATGAQESRTSVSPSAIR
jgi:hypothetical protein